MSGPINPLADDLDRVLAETGGLWEDLRGARVFITGGTGFFGCWLLETLLWANDRLDLGASVVVLTRNRRGFAMRAPHLALHSAVVLHDGDVRAFGFPAGRFSHVIHAAVETTPSAGPRDWLLEFDSTIAGMHRVLEFARASGATRLLFTSSGSVYGAQPKELARIPESYGGAPDVSSASAAGAEAKRAAEVLCALYADGRPDAVTARCFTFVGPYLPLDDKFAIGNFIQDGLQGGPIRVSGDGTALRSYLYAADLAIWLWTILLRGQPGRAYNVGSEDIASIADVARAVARRFDPVPAVTIAGSPKPGEPPSRYVPDTQRAQRELGLRVRIDFDDALVRTVQWHARRLAATNVHD